MGKTLAGALGHFALGSASGYNEYRKKEVNWKMDQAMKDADAKRAASYREAEALAGHGRAKELQENQARLQGEQAVVNRQGVLEDYEAKKDIDLSRTQEYQDQSGKKYTQAQVDQMPEDQRKSLGLMTITEATGIQSVELARKQAEARGEVVQRFSEEERKRKMSAIKDLNVSDKVKEVLSAGVDVGIDLTSTLKTGAIKQDVLAKVMDDAADQAASEADGQEFSKGKKGEKERKMFIDSRTGDIVSERVSRLQAVTGAGQGVLEPAGEEPGAQPGVEAPKPTTEAPAVNPQLQSDIQELVGEYKQGRFSFGDLKKKVPPEVYQGVKNQYYSEKVEELMSKYNQQGKLSKTERKQLEKYRKELSRP